MAALGLLGLLGFNWSEQRARSAAAARDQLRISPSEAAAEPLG
jgi:hypothetical protein